jgi:hypothetical protein
LDFRILQIPRVKRGMINTIKNPQLMFPYPLEMRLISPKVDMAILIRIRTAAIIGLIH